jgi:hypothetical protein
MSLDDMSDQLVRNAVTIAMTPSKYKVCSGCDMIYSKEKLMCHCGSYKFDDSVLQKLWTCLEKFPDLKLECEKLIQERKDYETYCTKNN